MSCEVGRDACLADAPDDRSWRLGAGAELYTDVRFRVCLIGLLVTALGRKNVAAETSTKRMDFTTGRSIARPLQHRKSVMISC